MISKLIFIIVATALLSIALAAVCHLAFPDLGAYAVGEDEVASWQREIAFMVKATAWLSAEVSGLFTIVLATYLWRNRVPKIP